uniref:Mannosylglycoprotein endo-beta-mannosidase n=1 Tax=Rhizophora mucronata TaxID=61149 RepID=A0A2P2M751_RHIMU
MAKIGKVLLDSGWLAARSTEVDLTGIQLTTTHAPSGPDSPWMEASVPGTYILLYTSCITLCYFLIISFFYYF